MYLEQIHEANDIKKLNEQELAGLAEEIRGVWKIINGGLP